ncbi:MAG: endonuclease [Halobacteriovoraceae bacterium]|nr:endonuclease [Halobacteriovoraceae bacterium]
MERWPSASLFSLVLFLGTLFPTFGYSGNYYDTQTQRQFESGSEQDRDLLSTVKYASSRNFRGLGYKKRAKKELFGNLHLERDGEGYFVLDVYCGFIVRTNVGPNRIPKNNEMNTEHTWPQSKGSRREPARGDLHHLYPTFNPANSARGNHPFGEVEGKDAARNCPLSQRGDIINPKTGKPTRTYGFQPPKNHRGNVARAMFYVSARYNYRLSDLEEFYLKKWHKDDPVDRNEIERNEGIEDLQGNRNPFIDYPELVSRIRDF